MKKKQVYHDLIKLRRHAVYIFFRTKAQAEPDFKLIKSPPHAVYIYNMTFMLRYLSSKGGDLSNIVITSRLQ
jgi:predicted nucleotidyltransferase